MPYTGGFPDAEDVFGQVAELFDGPAFEEGHVLSFKGLRGSVTLYFTLFILN